MGEAGEVGEGGAELAAGSAAVWKPFVVGEAGAEPSGDGGWARMALASSESASMSSGGRRSFSISDLRLEGFQ